MRVEYMEGEVKGVIFGRAFTYDPERDVIQIIPLKGLPPVEVAAILVKFGMRHPKIVREKA